jgi:ubiquinone/menaquinone biosynthesis C-methylase UbiE
MYDDERIARGYALDRPPVHEAILRNAGLTKVSRALDVGCGAGRSKRALKPYAGEVFGLEPQETMARWDKELTVVAKAEQIPFRDNVFQLITAAGALNYVDNGLFLAEAARVLDTGGLLLVYDCETGSHERLADWLEDFRQRAPEDPDYPMDPRELDFAAAGLRLESYQESQVSIEMSLTRYQRYILTETSEDIAPWCAETLPRAFGTSPLDVVFDTYAARVRLDP